MKDFDCIMLKCDISKKEWDEYISIIDKNDIYDTKDNDYGLEQHPHITLLYGIHTEDIDLDLSKK